MLVTATDRSGNKAKAKINVTVEELSKVVYMTFDDGPSENTDKILKILKKYDAKATFFVTGNNQKYNSSIKKAADQGNTIALHTYTHDYANVYSSTTAYFEDLQKSQVKHQNIFVSLVVQAIQFQHNIRKESCLHSTIWCMKEDMNILIGTAQVEMLHPIPCQHKTLCAMRQVAITNKS